MAADESDIDRWRDQQYQHWSDELVARRGAEHAPTLPELQGVRVRLRPLESGDEIQLHLWATTEHETDLWHDEPGMVGFDMFRQQLRHALAAGEPHLIVEGLNSGRMIGWVYADLLSLAHLRCRMHVYVIPEARSYGAGAEAGILFLDYLFGRLDMHKVFVETLVSQDSAREMAEHWGFEIEGVLREERRLGQQRYDVARLAIQRRDWHEKLIEATEATPSYRMPHMRRMLQMNGMFFPNTNAPQNL